MSHHIALVKAMTGVEKLDFSELRREMREGFVRIEDELRALGNRVQSLELTRGEQSAVIAERREVEELRVKTKAARGLTRNQLMAAAGVALGAFYGAVRLAHDLHLI